MKRQDILAGIGYTSLGVLLVLELTLQYDSWVRQVALATTDIFVCVALFLTRRFLRKDGSSLPWSVVWFSALGVWFDGMGNFAHFYANISWWDKVAHAVGSAALAAGIFVLLNVLQKRGTILLGTKMRWLFAVAITTMLSSIYEITEYLGDMWFHTNRIPDRYDSPDDMLWNFLATIAVTSVAVFLQSRRYPKTQEKKKPAIGAD